MTPDERAVLQRFLSDLEGTRGAAKDPEADGMIGSALSDNPDAAYLLVQHAILADQALQAAQQRIEALEASPLQAQGVGGDGQAPVSFLGGAPQPPARQDYPQTPEDQGGWGAQPAPLPQSPPQSPLSPNGGLGGFLKGAGTMAAGVAGGEFLAQGLSNLFSPRDW